MTTDELLNLAIENLEDSTKALVTIAKKPGYLNPNTPELNDLFVQISNRFQLCLTLKTAYVDVTSKRAVQ